MAPAVNGCILLVSMKTYIFSAALAASSAFFLSPRANAGPDFVDLGASSSFAVVAGSGITVAGAVASTHIIGNIGTFPTTSITGLEKVVLVGTNHAGDGLTQGAKTDLLDAYNDAASRAFNQSFAGGFDLGGLTLTSGVYNGTSSLFLTGTLTLDAKGNPDAVFIFQTGSTFITASNSLVQLIGGAQACHVFFQVGSSATLGTGTDFAGNILALESITVNTSADITGRLLALNGAVTLDTNTIDLAVCNEVVGGPGGSPVPDHSATLPLIGAGLAALATVGRKFTQG